MRETCARVLAAALMTGAIATVVAMSTLFEMHGQSGQPLTAPPSSLGRAIIFGPLPAPRHVDRSRTVPTRSRPARPEVVARVPVIARPRRPRPPQRDLAAAKVKPASAARTIASVAPVAPPPAPPSTTASSQVSTGAAHGNGVAKGHADDHGHGDQGQGGGRDGNKGGHGK